MDKFKIEKEYLEVIESNIVNFEYKFAFSSLLKTFKEKFELFENDCYSCTWFEALLVQFKEITTNKKLTSEKRLEQVIDLSIILEIKTKEVEIDINKKYVAGSLLNNGIV